MELWQKEELVTNMDKLKQNQVRGRPCADHMRGRQVVERSGGHARATARGASHGAARAARHSIDDRMIADAAARRS